MREVAAAAFKRRFADVEIVRIDVRRASAFKGDPSRGLGRRRWHRRHPHHISHRRIGGTCVGGLFGQPTLPSMTVNVNDYETPALVVDADVHNGLSRQENAVLARTPHIQEAIILVSRGLRKVLSNGVGNA